MRIKNKVVCVLTLFFVLSLTGCKNAAKADLLDNGKLNVAASFYTMNDFAQKIGGDKINIITIVPNGMEPHDFEPKTGDITRIKNAKVLIYNGAGMENWVDKVISSANNKELIAVEASKGITLLDGNEDKVSSKDNRAQKDPHVWLNPQNAIKEMSVIRDAFVKADPNNKDFYDKNFDNYKAKFDELDKEYKNSVSAFKDKNIVVAHAAFGYLCNAYGLNQVAIEGLSAESEPTAAKMAEIARFAKDNKVKVIFFEELVSPKIAQTIANEAGAKTDMLNPLEGISEEDSKKGKEYLSVMRDNLEALKRALN